LLGEGRIDVVERICHRRGGKYSDGLVLRINGHWRGLLHELPNDKSKRNDAQNYKGGSEILGFCAFGLPLCCYPPQEQTHKDAKYRVDDPTVAHGIPLAGEG
jgi:hypothetical protein